MLGVLGVWAIPGFSPKPRLQKFSISKPEKDLCIQHRQVDALSALPYLKTTVVKVLFTHQCTYNLPWALVKMKILIQQAGDAPVLTGQSCWSE